MIALPVVLLTDANGEAWSAVVAQTSADDSQLRTNDLKVIPIRPLYSLTGKFTKHAINRTISEKEMFPTEAFQLFTGMPSAGPVSLYGTHECHVFTAPSEQHACHLSGATVSLEPSDPGI